jgi:ribosomal protein S18
MELNKLLQIATPIIEKIASSRKIKNSFAYYTPEDIYQEIWFLCLEALNRYNKDFGELENFLNAHVSNRIKNLKRDKYFRIDQDELTARRINLVNALSICSVNISSKDKVFISANNSLEPIEYISVEELKDYIEERIPQHLLNSFKLLIEGHKINKKILLQIRSSVAVILKELDNA